MLPQPTENPTKLHFRNTNPRTLVRDLESGIRVHPPYHLYDKSFREHMHSVGALWDKEMRQWNIVPRPNQQEIAMGIVEKSFAIGWDVEYEHTRGVQLSPLKGSYEEGGWDFANAVWYEHEEDYSSPDRDRSYIDRDRPAPLPGKEYVLYLSANKKEEVE